MNFDPVAETAATLEPELKSHGPSLHIGASGKAHMVRHPRVPPVRADQDARPKSLGAPVNLESDPPPGFFPVQISDATALKNGDIFSLRLADQNMIQRSAGQSEAGGFAVARRQRRFGLVSRERRHAKRRDPLRRARKDFSLHRQRAQDRPIDRIDEVAAKFFPGKLLLVEERDAIAQPRQRYRRGRAGGAGADDGDIDGGHVQPRGKMSAMTRNGNAEKILKGPTSAWRNSARHSASVKARATDKGASVRVIALRVNNFVSR